MTDARTTDELDAISDDEFHALAHSDTETAIALADDQRQSMRDAYTGMVEAVDSDIRENFDPAEMVSDWALYATLRMNGVAYGATEAPRI